MNKGSKREHKALSIAAKVNSFAIKCYDEQLVFGLEATIQAIEQIDKNEYQVIGICHSRDEVSDGVWQVALEKRHYHIIVRCTNNKKRVRIYQLLNMLHIYFRPGLDDMLLLNHAIESIGSFQAYAMYLTHETADAIKENKELYDIDEIFSNLTIEEIRCVRDGYIRIADASEKVTMSKLAQLDEEAFKLGYELKNFTDWYNSLSFNIRSNSKMKVIEASYQRGVDKKIEENPELNRLCIFIKGEPNSGKTYAAKKALCGKKILCVGGGGSGKFDRLQADHNAIIIDDDICPNLLNMSDNYVCRAYKRNSNNPAWCGKYLVVTSNLSFSGWLTRCGIKIYEYGDILSLHYKAMLSRFYICVITKDSNGKSRLTCINVSDRGSKEAQEERKVMFEEFREKFDLTISEYVPSCNEVDYSNTLNIADAGCLAVEAK